jgi:hypothetical protein
MLQMRISSQFYEKLYPNIREKIDYDYFIRFFSRLHRKIKDVTENKMTPLRNEHGIDMTVVLKYTKNGYSCAITVMVSPFHFVDFVVAAETLRAR